MNESPLTEGTATRLESNNDAGFSLVELIIVIGMLGILLAVAVPAYFGFSDRARVAVAQANVRAIVPSVERFYSDNETYAGLDNAATASVPAWPRTTPTRT